MIDKLAGKLANRLAGKMASSAESQARNREADEVENLARLAEALRAVPHPSVPEEFRRNARIRILNRVSAGAPGQAVPRRPLDFKLRLTLGLRNSLYALTILVGFLFAGELLSFTAQNALPGDPLYQVKLGFEEVKDLFTSNEKDAVLQSRFASNRLTEIQLLVAAGRFDDIDPAVTAFEGNIDNVVTALAAIALHDGGSTYPILLQVERDMYKYSETLSDLRVFVPSDKHPLLDRAIAASRSLSLTAD